MDEETLARAYREATRGAASVPRPTPEALSRAVNREGGEAERLETLNAALASEEGQRELALLASVAAVERTALRQHQATVRWLAAAAGIAAVLTAGLWWKGRSSDQDNYRGAAGAIELVGVTARADSLQLIWRSVPAAQTYLLEVLDSDGRVVLKAQTADTSAMISAAIASRGALRWWVQTTTGTGTRASSIAPLNP